MTLQLDPAWLSVIASLILAVLTAIYVIQTQKMLRSMESSRKAEFQPHLKASLERIGPTIVFLMLKNVGKGSAIDVEAHFSVQPSDEPEKTWHHPLLAPEDSESFFLPTDDLEELAKKYDFVIIHGSCKDIFGESHIIDEKIDLKEIKKGWYEPGVVWKESLEENVEKMGEALKDIRNELRDIRSSLERLQRKKL